MSEDLATQIGAYVRALDETQLPVTLDDLTDRSVNNELADPVDLSPTSSFLAASVDTNVDSVLAKANEQLGDRSRVDVLWEDVERPAPSETGRWSSVAIAVAAAILVVVGVVVVADGNGGDVVTEPASSAAEADPLPSASVTEPASSLADSEPVPSPSVADAVPLPEVSDSGPPPSVVDSLGYRWSRLPHDEDVLRGAEMESVVAGGPGLVAVGSDGSDAAVWTSVDGIIWSRVPHDETVFGGDGNFWIHTVIAGGPGLVAIGREDGPSDIDVVWTSVDGLTWTRNEGVFEGGGPNGLIAGGPGLVAVGENEEGAVVWTSVDGLSWSRVPHDEEVFGHRLGDGNGMTGVTVGGPGLVAVGSDGLNSDAPTGRAQAVVWTSVDGLTWLRVPHDEAVFGGEGDQGMFDVVAGGPGLVAVGQDSQGAPVWTSVDGITWSRVPLDEDAFGGQDEGRYAPVRIFNVIATNAGLVAVGEDDGSAAPPVWTSVDGITWSSVPDDEGVFDFVELRSVTVGGPGLVAVTTVGVIVAERVVTPGN